MTSVTILRSLVAFLIGGSLYVMAVAWWRLREVARARRALRTGRWSRMLDEIGDRTW